MNAVKNLSIRLAAVGGDKIRQEFKSLGTDNQKAFRQITQVITPANDNLRALSDTAQTFNGVLNMPKPYYPNKTHNLEALNIAKGEYIARMASVDATIHSVKLFYRFGLG